ncbi:hypothetical protein KQR56_17150 [Bacillus velezensis]|nr:hypothetical protein [Bacillus velezensis]
MIAGSLLIVAVRRIPRRTPVESGQQVAWSVCHLYVAFCLKPFRRFSGGFRVIKSQSESMIRSAALTG